MGDPLSALRTNGIGLPKENRHRLTEPYMTTREKGTGLGLAIVKRIMEEHHGRLMLEDAPEDSVKDSEPVSNFCLRAHCWKKI